ncbi:MAG: NAD(P)H-hydrate dehydratase [Candidatus Izemoplasmatales bacterium]|jgi:hydroxyethylthiazole kinase-like uncharacterized protein yjeF
MLKIVTVEEMRTIEKSAMSKNNIAEYELVETAGSGLFRHFSKEVCPDKNKRLLVLAGPGNNGADALVFARHAFLAGYPVTVANFFEIGKESPAGRKALERLEAAGASILLAPEPQELTFEEDVVVDGLFGIGVDRLIEGRYCDLIERVNHAGKFVFSIDIPSGINGHTGLVSGVAIKADWTAAIGYLKVGNLLNDALDYSGAIKVVDIGLTNDTKGKKRRLANYEDIIPILSNRKHRSHKYNYGDILVIGGSPGMMGAMQLAGIAALRSGAGVVRVAIKEKDKAYWNQLYPELIYVFYEQPKDLDETIKKADFCIFGVGIDHKGDQNHREILESILKIGTPVLIDAGGLDYLKELLARGVTFGHIIATPHAGELARMLEIDARELEADCEKQIAHLTQKGIVTVLKGHVTIVAKNDRLVYLKAGNPGMASAGMGDLLSGMIAAMATQGNDLFEAAVRGGLLHAKAAEIALSQIDETGLIATDVLQSIGKAVKALKIR